MNALELARYLREHHGRLDSLPIVTGFDGFVDEMISVVDQRQSLNDYRRIETIDQFGAKIGAAAGHSSLREIVINETDPGGCAVNMGDGMASLGLPVTTFATVGEPVHPAFAEYAKRARLISWGAEPGRTLAYEFSDGKLMFSAVSQLQEFNPENLCGYLKDEVFRQCCEEAELIAITDWSLYPHMTECWRFLIEEVFSKMTRRPRFFFDLVDPSSRSDTDILGMQDVLERFGELGEVTLGLNQNETNILCRLNGLQPTSANDPLAALVQGRALRDKMGLHAVVIHSIKYAVGIDDADETHVRGPYCEKPLKSTGAGDRFNAGYALGLVLGLEMADRLILACASSGFFVRNARSPSLEELCGFLVSI